MSRLRTSRQIIPPATSLLLALALLAACGDSGQGNQAQPPPAAVVATEAQAGATLNLRVGQDVEFRLHGNETIDPPTAWSIDAAPPNLRMSRVDVLSDAPQAEGAGTHWVFRFTAVAAGREEITFNGGDSGLRAAFVIVTS